MRTKEEITEQISTAIDIEASMNPTHPSVIRAEGIRQALDWVLLQQDQPPFEDE